MSKDPYLGLTQATQLPDDRALVPVLTAWRDTRAVQVADLLDALDQHLTPTLPEIPSARWVQRCALDDAADLGPLLRTFPPRRLKDAQQRLVLLAQRAPDPRLARALLDLLDAPPFVANDSLGFWALLVRTVLAIGDSRSAARLTDHRAIAGRFADGMAPGIRRLLQLAGGGQKTAAPRTPPRNVLKSIERLGDRWRPDDRIDQLIDAVYAAPNEPAHRLVLADLCASRGDPRGTFILLQMAATEGRLDADGRARMQSLQRRCWRDWAAPLDALFRADSVTFEGGFLAGGTLDPKRRERLPELVGDRAWRTVRRLTVPPEMRLEAGQLALPQTENIHTLRGTFSPDFIMQLAAGPIRAALKTLASVHLGPPPKNWCPDAPGLPGVRSMTVVAAPRTSARQSDWFLSGALVAQLAELTVHVDQPDTADAWLAHAPATLKMLRLVHAVQSNNRITIRLGARGLDVNVQADADRTLASLIDGVAGLPSNRLRTVSLKWTGSTPVNPDLETQLLQLNDEPAEQRTGVRRSQSS